MAAPESPTCRRDSLVADLVYHGALAADSVLLDAEPCDEPPARRVRFHIIAAGMGTWFVREMCGACSAELAELPQHSSSFPISP